MVCVVDWSCILPILSTDEPSTKAYSICPWLCKKIYVEHLPMNYCLFKTLDYWYRWLQGGFISNIFIFTHILTTTSCQLWHEVSISCIRVQVSTYRKVIITLEMLFYMYTASFCRHSQSRFAPPGMQRLPLGKDLHHLLYVSISQHQSYCRVPLPLENI